MIKNYIILILVLAPPYLSAQNIHPLKRNVEAGSHLLNVNQKVVLIDQIDVASESQLWTTFDTALKIISQKRMVTPEAEMLISQTFLPANNKVLRIDQMLINDQIQIGAFVFDTEGSLLHVKAVPTIPAPGTSITKTPFLISQSPDKKSFALVHAQAYKDDSLAVAAVVLNDSLNIISSTGFSFYYESILSDILSPLLNNEHKLIIAIADKFESFKLSAFIKAFVISKERSRPEMFELTFDRKKLKNNNLSLLENKLNVSSLYSTGNNKGNIAGVLVTSYDLTQKNKTEDKYFAYSPDAIKDLKKIFGNEGRKGHLLNYIAQMPLSQSKENYNFAVLLPGKSQVSGPTSKPIPPPIEGLGKIKQHQNLVNSLVGTIPSGSTKPLSIAEANTYASSMIGKPSHIINTDDYYKNPYNKAYKPQIPKKYKRNLLFFSFEEGQQTHRFTMLRPIQDEAYSFTAYVPETDGYSVLHYLWPSFKRSYLNKTTVDSSGKLSEKNVFEDKAKVLKSNYPFIIFNNQLIGFYEDRFTGEMGLVNIKL